MPKEMSGSPREKRRDKFVLFVRYIKVVIDFYPVHFCFLPNLQKNTRVFEFDEKCDLIRKRFRNSVKVQRF